MRKTSADKAAAEAERLENLSKYEREYFNLGITLIAGVDEVGRGPLAGPVVACAVILPAGSRIAGVDDSKKLPQKKREALNAAIRAEAVSISISEISENIIDDINILQATRLAMRNAIENLSVAPEMILVDAVEIPGISTPQKGIIHGDGLSISIAAASIAAKVYRDELMNKYHALYPVYGFDRNKGYGTREHIAAIREHGLCPVHRLTFVKKLMGA